MKVQPAGLMVASHHIVPLYGEALPFPILGGDHSSALWSAFTITDVQHVLTISHMVPVAPKAPLLGTSRPLLGRVFMLWEIYLRGPTSSRCIAGNEIINRLNLRKWKIEPCFRCAVR